MQQRRTSTFSSCKQTNCLLIPTFVHIHLFLKQSQVQVLSIARIKLQPQKGPKAFTQTTSTKQIFACHGVAELCAVSLMTMAARNEHAEASIERVVRQKQDAIRGLFYLPPKVLFGDPPKRAPVLFAFSGTPRPHTF